jgi:hypothetical protein
LCSLIQRKFKYRIKIVLNKKIFLQNRILGKFSIFELSLYSQPSSRMQLILFALLLVASVANGSPPSGEVVASPSSTTSPGSARSGRSGGRRLNASANVYENGNYGGNGEKSSAEAESPPPRPVLRRVGSASQLYTAEHHLQVIAFFKYFLIYIYIYHIY